MEVEQNEPYKMRQHPKGQSCAALNPVQFLHSISFLIQMIGREQVNIRAVLREPLARSGRSYAKPSDILLPWLSLRVPRGVLLSTGILLARRKPAAAQALRCGNFSPAASV